MDRMVRLRPDVTPDALAAEGKGDKRELWLVNKTWLSSGFTPWNPGQQMVVPAAWGPVEGEYASE